MTLLIEAAKNGDVRLIQELLEAGANVNETNADNNESPLSMAAFYRHLEVVSLLLNNGADVNERDRLGNTALVHAAGVGDLELTRLLLERGADSSRATDYGVTPLITAAYGGCSEVVSLLISRGADTSARDEAGMTALDWARARKHHSVATMLKVADI